MRITRELDLASRDDFERILSDCQTSVPLIVDLSSCPYLDSSGLETLIARHGSEACMAVVVSKGSAVDRVFELTNLTRVLNVFPTLAAAKFGIAAARTA